MSDFLTDVQIGGRNLRQHWLLLGLARRGPDVRDPAGDHPLGHPSTSMRESMLKSATTLMSGHVNVGGFFKVTAGQMVPW